MPEQIDVVDATARPLPAERAPGAVEIWGREVGPLAAAAGAGAAAGIFAVAVAHSRSARKVPRRGLFRRREKILGRRSFLVDIHVLGR